MVREAIEAVTPQKAVGDQAAVGRDSSSQHLGRPGRAWPYPLKRRVARTGFAGAPPYAASSRTAGNYKPFPGTSKLQALPLWGEIRPIGTLTL